MRRPTAAARNFHGRPGDGAGNTRSTEVQNRTAVPLAERFTNQNGIFTTRVFPGEERVEMRWANWPRQNRENMWDGDINFEAVSSRTAIMQIKSNTGGEPIYLQVTTNGTIRNNGDGTPLATNMAGKWFNWKAAFNPATGVSRAWINDALVKSRQFNTSSRDWYFKNGTYTCDSTICKAYFKNIHLYER